MLRRDAAAPLLCDLFLGAEPIFHVVTVFSCYYDSMRLSVRHQTLEPGAQIRSV